MSSVTIEFPASLPEEIASDQDFFRYTIAAALYHRGLLSGKEARELTGEGSRRRFEEKMAEYGYPLMPGRPEDIAIELNA